MRAFHTLSMFIVTTIIATSYATATRAPWADNAKKCRSRTFLDCSENWDSTAFHTGEDYIAGYQDLYPMDSGNIKFFIDNEGPASNCIIIDYGTYASMYLHIENGSVVANFPVLYGKQRKAINEYASQNKVVAKTAPTWMHVHIEIGADRNSFENNKSELVSPSFKFQDVFRNCVGGNPAPVIRHVCGYPEAPVGSTVYAYIDASDKDNANCLFDHTIYKIVTKCNGEEQDRLELNEYLDMAVEDRWVPGDRIWPCGSSNIWYLKTQYRVASLGPNNIEIFLYDDCGQYVEHTWTTVDVNDIRNFNADNSGYKRISLNWEIIEGYTVTSVDLYRSDHPLGPYEKINVSPIPITHSGAYSYFDYPQHCMNYYYKIWAAGPGEGYKTATPFPIFLDYADGPPAAPQPVSNLSASDKAFDSGKVIALSWVLSPSDSAIEKYNIYRGTNIYDYFASVPSGTSAFEDTSVQQDFEFCFKVIAHN